MFHIANFRLSVRQLGFRGYDKMAKFTLSRSGELARNFSSIIETAKDFAQMAKMYVQYDNKIGIQEI